MKVRQVIVWEVDVQTIDDANEVVMAEFRDPREGEGWRWLVADSCR